MNKYPNLAHLFAEGSENVQSGWYKRGGTICLVEVEDGGGLIWVRKTLTRTARGARWDKRSTIARAQAFASLSPISEEEAIVEEKRLRKKWKEESR